MQDSSPKALAPGLCHHHISITWGWLPHFEPAFRLPHIHSCFPLQTMLPVFQKFLTALLPHIHSCFPLQTMLHVFQKFLTALSQSKAILIIQFDYLFIDTPLGSTPQAYKPYNCFRCKNELWAWRWWQTSTVYWRRNLTSLKRSIGITSHWGWQLAHKSNHCYWERRRLPFSGEIDARFSHQLPGKPGAGAKGKHVGGGGGFVAFCNAM